MNIKMLAGALAVGLLSSTAMAADLPSRRAPAPVVVAPAPIFTWSGFYVGAQLGYAWDKVSLNNVWWGAGWGNPSLNRDGIVGGAHVGFLFQPAGPLVLGVEGDLEGSSVRGSGIRGSVRGRLGVTFDRALIYATGGLAWGNFRYTTIAFWPWTVDVSKTHTGWTVGGGVEYALTNNWSARLEYRYTDWGKINNTWIDARRTEHAVRAGVSYRFNWGGPVAVVARY